MEAFQGTWLYRINLDLYKYGLSRDESVSEPMHIFMERDV